MAIGDVVSEHIATSTDFQPAAGVECVITLMMSSNTTALQATDGTAVKNIQESITTQVISKLLKLFITNTNYITVPAGPVGFYSGVQIAT